MKKVLTIAGVSALTITLLAYFAHLTSRTSNSVAEQYARIYEREPNWISWTKCYVNNFPDLREQLPSWLPSISHYHSDGEIVNYSVRNLEAAGRLHYLLYGYDEKRMPECSEKN